MFASISLILLSAPIATPPLQQPVTTVLGPKAYRDGDVVEIREVTATSSRLEQGDSVTVKGRVHLQSQMRAKLCLYVTATQGAGSGKTDPAQCTIVSQGQSDFELKTTIRNRGVLHVTFYDQDSGRPLGGTYFGTVKQMTDIADWDVSYYLSDSDDHSQKLLKKLQMLQQLQPTTQSMLGIEFQVPRGYRYVRIDSSSTDPRMVTISAGNDFQYSLERVPTSSQNDD